MAARLDKQPDNISPLMNWEAWAMAHATPILFVLVIVLFLLVLAVTVAMFNVAAAPTVTEANTYYYALERII